MELDRRTCDRARLARDARFDGRFFTAVRSTHIYCRPICPAPRPKASNVVYYPTAAAAAAAGYRPCLRCRPEASPGTPGWLGSSASVSRALKLIGEGALDEDGVDDLARRLGVGARHLRRMFLQHVGATPIAVAQTRRVHFAKKLIDETRLPMTQIALTSGFGSLRRFNTTLKQLYGRAPTELRRVGRGEPRVEAGVYTLELRYRPPYDWASLAGFLRARAIPGVEQVTESEYRRVIELDGEVGALCVRPKAGEHALELRIELPSPRGLFRVVERVRDLFDLRADPAQIAAHLGRHPRLRQAVRAHPGLRVPGAWDGFEMAVRAVLGQQVSVAAATTIAGRLVARYGRPHAGGSLFPTPDALAAADPRSFGLPKRRAHSIVTLAEAVATRQLVLEATRGPTELEARLTELPGIGPWTAQYVAMRLGEPDAFPAGDLYLRDHARDADAWRPWRAYAAMYLWRKCS